LEIMNLGFGFIFWRVKRQSNAISIRIMWVTYSNHSNREYLLNEHSQWCHELLWSTKQNDIYFHLIELCWSLQLH
jgi:hypothetical protein